MHKNEIDLLALTKFAGWLLSPLPLAILGGLLALGLVMRGWRRAGGSLAVLSLAALWLAATPWVAWNLAMSLEQRYPAVPSDATPAVDALIVLGGAVVAAQPPRQPHLALGSAADRVWHAGALYRAGKVRWVLLSGGNQPGYEGIPAEAQAMREMLLVLGVPDSAIRMEGRSRNTRENAGYSLQLMKQINARRVLLVTSALHMPRAMALFQEACEGSGVELVAAATDVEAVDGALEPVGQWLPNAASLAWTSRALKEYLGLAHIWLTKGLF